MSPYVRKPPVTFAPITQRLMNQRQAAAYLGVSMSTFNRLVMANEIPVVKIVGRGKRARRMFDKADLDRWIEANKHVLAD